jgi:hypothetical protein
MAAIGAIKTLEATKKVIDPSVKAGNHALSAAARRQISGRCDRL